ncbi:MAG: tetratricopeptide repeat protein, partial [Armatimonadetes bacterium]|nr:tetratricopeptide repeat protein [Armatimonadota bacterium]
LGLKYFFEEPRNVAAAAREFQQVTELAPYWDEGYGWLSAALEEINQTDWAISSLRQAMRLAPENARYPISLGRIFLRRHDYSKAIKLFRKGISLKPHYGEAEAHLFLAEALVGAGNIEEARQEWQSVMTLQPMYPSFEKLHEEVRHLLNKHSR